MIKKIYLLVDVSFNKEFRFTTFVDKSLSMLVVGSKAVAATSVEEEGGGGGGGGNEERASCSRFT